MSITTAPSGPVTSECGTPPGMRQMPPGPRLLRLVAERERDRALEHEAQLLIRMLVLRHDRAGVELDDGQGQLLAADDAPVDAVEDPLQVELLHGWQVPGSVHRRRLYRRRA